MNCPGFLYPFFSFVRKKMCHLNIVLMPGATNSQNGDSPEILHCRINLYLPVKSREFLNRAMNGNMSLKVLFLEVFVLSAPHEASRWADSCKLVRHSYEFVA